MRSAPRSFMGGGLFLGCENTAGGGSSSRSSGGGTDASRSASSTNILGRTDVTIVNREELKDVLTKAGFLDNSGKFKNTPPNPDPNGPKTDFAGLLLVKRTDGTTKYVDVNKDSSGNYSLADNPYVEDGVQVVAVYKETAKTVKKIKIEIEPGKVIEVPVSFDSSSSNPTLQEVQDALTEYGIKPDLIGSVPNTPKCPDASYPYKGVTTGSGTLKPTDQISGDTLKPVFQKDVVSKIDIGNGTPVPVTKTATYGDAASQKATLEDLLKAANGGSVPTPTEQGKTFDGWYVTKPGSTQPEYVSKNDIGSTEVPLGSYVKPSFVDPTMKNISLTIPNPGDPSGSISIPFTVPASTDENTFSTTWGEIKNKGGAGIASPTAPAGYTFKEWQKGGTPVTDSTTVSKADASTIKPVFTKEVSYKVYFGAKGANLKEAKFTITYPDTKAEQTVYDIFTKTGATSFAKDGVLSYKSKIFTGWRVSYVDANKKEDFITADTIVASNTQKYASDAVACFYADYAAFKDKMGGIDDMDATAVEGNLTTIGNIFVANTEVTQKQWNTVMSEVNYPQRNGGYDENNKNKPMVNITWYDAVAFCNYLSKREDGNFSNAVYYVTINGVDEYDPGKWGDVPALNAQGSNFWKEQLNTSSKWNNIKMNKERLGYRLPTMDEWFYVAHGGKETKYPVYSGTSGSTENDLKKVGWYNGNAGGTLHDVGSLPENTSPVKDMTGNAWELCWGTDDYGNVSDKGYNAGPKVGGAIKAGAGQCELATNPKDTGASKTSYSADTGFRVVANQPK